MTARMQSIFFVTALLSLATLAHAFKPQSMPPSSYPEIAPAWQVSSAFGPRADNSPFHKGIDFTQQAGDNDKGVILKAREAGDILFVNARGLKSIKLHNKTTDDTLGYLHIFDDTRLPIIWDRRIPT